MNTNQIICLFSMVARLCGDYEYLEDLRADAEAGDDALPKLRGFLQGLYAAGSIGYEDVCEVDAWLGSRGLI